MADQLQVGNKLIPGTPGAFSQPSQMQSELEERLVEQMAIARERASRSAEATGTRFVEGDGRLGFTPTAIRTKRGAMFKDELSKVKTAIDDVIGDVMKSSSFADQATRVKRELELRGRGHQVQKMLVEAGLQADLQITRSKLDQQQKNSLYNAFAGIASSIGFGLAYRGKGKGPDYAGQADEMMQGLQQHPVYGQGF